MTQSISNNPCACGRAQNYDQCCGRYITAAQIPATAEDLMRSRYTAYTKANIAYIQATMCDRAAIDFDPIQAENWAKSVKWKRLKVLRTFPHATDQQRYYVEFTAYFMWQGRPQQLREISEFKQVDGRWYYVDHMLYPK